MRFAVGSLNPVKVSAVQAAVTRVWPDAQIEAHAVDSGIESMPTTSERALEGATNRASRALEASGTDFGIGLEGFTYDSQDAMFMSGWVVVVSQDGRKGIGGANSVMLPQIVAARIRKGEELGPIMDELQGDTNTKQKGGAMGFLTKGLIDRKKGFENSVICALVPFMNSEIY
jgi:inosine/xanthosine triphosphatase